MDRNFLESIVLEIDAVLSNTDQHYRLYQDGLLEIRYRISTILDSTPTVG